MLKKISNKRNILALAATLLIVSMMAISCSAQGVAEPEDTVDVFFGNLVAKGTAATPTGDGIDHTAYDYTASGTYGTAIVDPGAIDDYYWAYRAEKKDNLYKRGDTSVQTEQETETLFMPVVEGKGLGTVKGFSRGDWEFELRAYKTKDERKAGASGKGASVVFMGIVGNTDTDADNKINYINLQTTQSVEVPVTYSYEDFTGTGEAAFSFEVAYKQDTATTTPINEYDVKVLAYIGTQSLELTADSWGETITEDGADKGFKKCTYTGTITEVPYGIHNTVKFEVYVNGELIDGSKATAGGNNASANAVIEKQKAVVMTRLTTNITGSAKIAVGEGGLIDVTFTTSTSSVFNSDTGVNQPNVDLIKTVNGVAPKN